MNKFGMKLLGMAIAAGINMFSAGSAMATMETFQITNGNVGDGSNLANASITFNTSANQVQITLNNTSNTHAAGELLYGVTFTISGVTSAPSIAGLSGQQETGDSSSYSYGSVSSNSSLSSPWTTSINTGVYSLTGSSADDLVISAPQASGNPYPSANPSVFNHTPWLATGATFTLGVSGVSASSTISDATFEFGSSGSSAQLPASQMPTPEPATLGLMTVGGIALLMKKRKKA
ncbi:MAG TPA: PEP-CTERM sorting domain-containing protein [Phycisphaerae bacterium]|nr:PEP-CTERM sorting domain-containing protein [Phycisphaerae bacterium]